RRWRDESSVPSGDPAVTGIVLFTALFFLPLPDQPVSSGCALFCLSDGTAHSKQRRPRPVLPLTVHDSIFSGPLLLSPALVLPSGAAVSLAVSVSEHRLSVWHHRKETAALSHDRA